MNMHNQPSGKHESMENLATSIIGLFGKGQHVSMELNKVAEGLGSNPEAVRLAVQIYGADHSLELVSAKEGEFISCSHPDLDSSLGNSFREESLPDLRSVRANPQFSGTAEVAN